MKRILVLALLCASVVASAQTALYKRYADRPGVQAYCVERYPLSSGDSVCVTLLQTGDSAIYRNLCRELHMLPYAPRRKSIEGTIGVAPSQEQGSSPALADSLASLLGGRKHLVVFNADALPGDEGYYAIYCPSDRMVVLAFLVTNENMGLKIASHMTETEFR